jgi:hypothetical protein
MAPYLCLIVVKRRRRGSEAGTAVRLQAGGSGFSKTCRRAGAPSQPPIGREMELFPSGKSGQDVKVTTHI